MHMTNDPSVQSDLDAMLLPWGDVTSRRMFGGLGYFVGDRMFAVYHRGAVAAKLPDAERERALEGGHGRPFTPMPGRRFGNWVEFPVEAAGDVEALLPWLETAFEHVQVTPPSGRRASRSAR